MTRPAMTPQTRPTTTQKEQIMTTTTRPDPALDNVLRDLRTIERSLIEASQAIGDFHHALRAATDPADGFDGFAAHEANAVRANLADRLMRLNGALRSVQDDSTRALFNSADIASKAPVT